MHSGSTIHGKISNYAIQKQLGEPGLYGIAYLAKDPNGQFVVIKALRPERPTSDKERVFVEAETLRKVAEQEDAAGVHYAVRVLDESPNDAPQPFIVLEQATGQNVLNDLVERIGNWDHAPLAEATGLAIMTHFARALHYVHQAGLCYDDMKLDNLFWDTQREHPLRIIDWNVTSPITPDHQLSGDWVRFGARLYQMLTGRYLSVNRDGDVAGSVEDASNWQSIPQGLRVIITKALHGGYTKDEMILQDLEREQSLQGQPSAELVRMAKVFAGRNQWEAAASSIGRVQQYAAELSPLQHAEIEQIQSDIEASTGQARNDEVEAGKQVLVASEFNIAIEHFTGILKRINFSDARPRWWLLIAEIAKKQGRDWYQQNQNQLFQVIYNLEKKDFEQAAKVLNYFFEKTQNDSIKFLAIEAEARLLEGKLAGSSQPLENLQQVIAKVTELKPHFTQYSDLKQWSETLNARLAKLKRQQERETRYNDLYQTAQRALADGDSMSRQSQWSGAYQNYTTAQNTLIELRRDATPDQATQLKPLFEKADATITLTAFANALTNHAPIATIENLAPSFATVKTQIDQPTIIDRIQTLLAQRYSTENSQTHQRLQEVQEFTDLAVDEFDLPTLQQNFADIHEFRVYGDDVTLQRAIMKHKEQIQHLISQAQQIAPEYKSIRELINNGQYDQAATRYQQMAEQAPQFAWIAQHGTVAQANNELDEFSASGEHTILEQAKQRLATIDKTTSRNPTLKDDRAKVQRRIADLDGQWKKAQSKLPAQRESQDLTELGTIHREYVLAREAAPNIGVYAQQAKNVAQSFLEQLQYKISHWETELAMQEQHPSQAEVTRIHADITNVQTSYPFTEQTIDNSWDQRLDSFYFTIQSLHDRAVSLRKKADEAHLEQFNSLQATLNASKDAIKQRKLYEARELFHSIFDTDIQAHPNLNDIYMEVKQKIESASVPSTVQTHGSTLLLENLQQLWIEAQLPLEEFAKDDLWTRNVNSQMLDLDKEQAIHQQIRHTIKQIESAIQYFKNQYTFNRGRPEAQSLEALLQSIKCYQQIIKRSQVTFADFVPLSAQQQTLYRALQKLDASYLDDAIQQKLTAMIDALMRLANACEAIQPIRQDLDNLVKEANPATMAQQAEYVDRIRTHETLKHVSEDIYTTTRFFAWEYSIEQELKQQLTRANAQLATTSGRSFDLWEQINSPHVRRVLKSKKQSRFNVTAGQGSESIFKELAIIKSIYQSAEGLDTSVIRAIHLLDDEHDKVDTLKQQVVSAWKQAVDRQDFAHTPEYLKQAKAIIDLEKIYPSRSQKKPEVPHDSSNVAQALWSVANMDEQSWTPNTIKQALRSPADGNTGKFTLQPKLWIPIAIASVFLLALLSFGVWKFAFSGTTSPTSVATTATAGTTLAINPTVVKPTATLAKPTVTVQPTNTPVPTVVPLNLQIRQPVSQAEFLVNSSDGFSLTVTLTDTIPAEKLGEHTFELRPVDPALGQPIALVVSLQEDKTLKLERKPAEATNEPTAIPATAIPTSNPTAVVSPTSIITNTTGGITTTIPITTTPEPTPEQNNPELAKSAVQYHLWVDGKEYPNVTINIGERRRVFGVTEKNGALPAKPKDNFPYPYVFLSDNADTATALKGGTIAISINDEIGILEVKDNKYRVRLLKNFDTANIQPLIDNGPPIEGWVERTFIDNVK